MSNDDYYERKADLLRQEAEEAAERDLEPYRDGNPLIYESYVLVYVMGYMKAASFEREKATGICL